MRLGEAPARRCPSGLRQQWVARYLSAVLMAGFTLGCASTRADAGPQGQLLANNENAGVDASPLRPRSSAVGACPARVPSGALRRQVLDRTLDRGLGTWLRGVDIEPHVVSGRFGGWLLRSVYPGDPCYQDLDLRAGDVITRINGRAIERPEQAHQVWLALRRANALVVDYRRGPAVRRIEIPITER